MVVLKNTDHKNIEFRVFTCLQFVPEKMFLVVKYERGTAINSDFQKSDRQKNILEYFLPEKIFEILLK